MRGHTRQRNHLGVDVHFLAKNADVALASHEARRVMTTLFELYCPTPAAGS